MTSLPAVFRRQLPIALLALSAADPAMLWAQTPQLVQAIPDANGPVERLGRYIRVLASSPRNIDALLGAGQAALDVGDANAALGFYARAEEVSPGSGRVKAGLGSSLVMIERPDDALRLFAEAVALGVPEAALARDRGLAYDLRGDSKRAQRDYALAMARRDPGARDDELVRRYALSLGISGDRSGAMAMLDPLLRKQDQGAWRARAFIMAMSGDAAGANGVARQLMVPAMANAMAPLLARLSSLNASERAHAVNFGTVPWGGTQFVVQTGDPYLGAVPLPSASALVSAQGLSRPPVASGDAGLIPAGEPLGPRAADVKPVRVAQANSTEPRRRPGATVPVTTPVISAANSSASQPVQPGFTEPPVARRVGERVGRRIGDVVTPDALPTVASIADGAPVPAVADPAPRLPAPAPASAGSLSVSPAQIALATPPATAPIQGPPATDVAVADMPVADQRTPIQATELPASTLAQPAPSPALNPIPTSSAADTAATRLAGLLDGIERESETVVALPGAAELRAARTAARKKMAQLAAQTAAEEAAKREAAERAAAAKRNPARIWVQVATGRNDSGLGLTLKRIRSDNEVALKGLSGWSAPYKATNRILVGPMRSAAAARDLVGKLGKNGVSAMTFSSDPGEEVEKIATK